MQGKLLFYDTLVTSIYYYNNQVIYNSSYYLLNKSKNLWADKVEPNEVYYYFFVFTKGMKEGLYFDKRKSSIPLKLSVDSVLKKEWSNNIDVHTSYKKSGIKLISQTNNKDSGTLINLYNFKMNVAPFAEGTTTFYFNKNLNDIDYTFFKELDSTMQMKLYKIEIKNNPRYLKEHNMHLDEIQQLFFLERINVVNEKELLDLFEKEKMSHLQN